MGNYEETVRKNQNEIFDSMPYPIYLYSHQELSAENVYFKGARHFINISRDRHIHEDHDKGVSTSSISKKYRITSRRVQQILHWILTPSRK